VSVLRHVAIVGICGGALWAAHPAPPVAWFDTTYIAHRMLEAPSLGAAMRFAAQYHSYPRPTRVLEWWVGAALVGESSLGYHVLNVIFVALSLWAVVWVAESLTGSRGRAYFVGAAMGVSYVTVYPLLHFPYGVQLALAFVGFALLIAGSGPWMGFRMAVGAASIVFASLAHEVFLTFTVLPWLYHRLVHPLPRWAVGASFAGLPVWVLTQVVVRSSSLPKGAQFDTGVVEHVSRVLVSLVSGGLPAEMLRLLPVAPPFTRIRESLVTGPGLFLLLAVGAPTLLLVPIALRRPWSGRVRFLVLWLLIGSVPLLLPVGTPESYHLAGAMPAVFLLWSEAFSGAGNALRAIAAVAVLGSMAMHAFARLETFHADIRLTGQVARSLRAVIHASPAPVVALFPPAQVGGHYGYWPALPAEGACLLEPIWVWRAWELPRLPTVCREGNTITVGPLSPEVERLFLGARAMLRHPTASAFTYSGPRDIMGACPLKRHEVIGGAGAVWWRYALEGGEAAHVVRLELTPSPQWVPVLQCRAGWP
jgi:hypothetical protein